jgi:alkyl hydroperoxide reductase subunit AhpC
MTQPITITLKRAVFIINQHGNLNEINYFFKELGRKKVYKLSDVKNWLGY